MNIVSFIQECLMSSLIEIVPVVVYIWVFLFCQCALLVRYYLEKKIFKFGHVFSVFLEVR